MKVEPFGLQLGIEPHELELGAACNFPIILIVKLLHHVQVLLFWFVSVDEYDAESSGRFEADIICAFFVHFRANFCQPLLGGWTILATSTARHIGLTEDIHKLKHFFKAKLLFEIIGLLLGGFHYY